MAENEAVISISTLRRRRRVEIDGDKFELLDVDEISAAGMFAMQALAKNLGRLKESDDHNGGEAITKSLIEGMRLILPEYKTPEQLTDRQRMAVLEVFYSAPTRTAPAAAESSREEAIPA